MSEAAPHLRPVSDDDADWAAPRPKPSIPDFEGRPVARHEFKVSGAVTLNSEEATIDPVSMDDRVRLVGVFRVTKVHFVTDERTGDVVRQQILAPVELDTCPWDASDPNDDGILRAPR